MIPSRFHSSRAHNSCRAANPETGSISPLAPAFSLSTRRSLLISSFHPQSIYTGLIRPRGVARTSLVGAKTTCERKTHRIDLIGIIPNYRGGGLSLFPPGINFGFVSSARISHLRQIFCLRNASSVTRIIISDLKTKINRSYSSKFS